MSNVMTEVSVLTRTEPMRSISFREAHDLTSRGADRLLGFTGLGRACRRWEENGVPPHVDTLMAYVDRYGPEVAEEIATKRDAQIKAAFDAKPGTKGYIHAVPAEEFKVPAMAIFNWRSSLGLPQRSIDRLFGFTSKGRACRLWEVKGAPPYVEVFKAYVDKYGLDLADEMAKARESDEG